MPIFEEGISESNPYDRGLVLPPVDNECEACLEPRVMDGPAIRLAGQHRFVPRQFILTGATEDVATLVELALGGLDPLSTLPLEGLAGRHPFGEEMGGVAKVFAPDDLSTLTVNLYEVPDGEDLASTLASLQEVVDGGTMNGPVLIDLNYVTGFGITGAPWGVEGVPWGVEGVAGSMTPAAATDLYWRQWAFTGPHGIGRISTAGGLQPLGDQTGENVRVALFDSSPFEQTGCYRFDGWLSFPPTRRERTTPLEIHTWRPVAVPVTVPGPADLDIDISDHGLFAAGLTYGVAPEAELHLVEVLNSHGQGDLHSLLRAMVWFTEEVLDCSDGHLHLTEAEQLLTGTIYNLSLVARPDNEGDDLPPELRDIICEVAALFNYPQTPFPVISLELIMQMIVDRGGVIVSAAGNGSAGKRVPLTAGLPAAYVNVIGVGASNQKGERSCYSNEGDLYAPGGDGRADPASKSGCVPGHTTCATGDANCPFGVVSVASKLPGGPGFAYWVGTSFATPLVSGLAALRLEALVPPADVAADLAQTGGKPVVQVKP